MKKVFILIMSLVFLVASVPTNCFAETKAAVTGGASEDIVADSPSATEPTDQTLESAIKAAKEKITIPEEYSEFDYYFDNMYSGSSWSLTWRNPTTDATIQVTCDENNHITSYYKYGYENNKTGVAKYLKSELKPTAESFIKQVAPEVADNLKLVDISYESYSGDYSYSYQRYQNDVDFSDNTVSVSVNSITGEVTYFNAYWTYDATVPSATTKITKNDASALIKKNMNMKLVYKSDYSSYYGENATSKAFLVYEPTEYYLSVDAKTGEIYTTNNEVVDSSGYNYTEEAAAYEYDKTSDVSSGLTDDEISKVEDLQNLISKEKAIKTVAKNKYLYLDENLTQCSATLNKNYTDNGKEEYVWNVTLNDPREVNYETDTDTYRGYAYATVDATTGKILSFFSSVKSNYDDVNQKWNSVKVKYDNAEGQKILEKFLKTQMKDRFANSVLVDATDDYVAFYKKDVPVYGGYLYQYNRVNEGIEYEGNSIYGSVDGVTGKIYSFGSYWEDNITFESPEGVISADKAMEYYLSNEDYGLKYEVNQIGKYDYYDILNSSIEYEIRLVYRSDIYPEYISPFTGEQLDYYGKAYTEAQPYEYKDVDHSEINRNILLLSDMNIGFEGENFLPNQNITIGEIYSVLSNAGYWTPTTDQADSTDLITREVLAQTLINWLGLENMSKLNVYDTGYNDEAAIDSNYFGAVALAKGLGIMMGDSSNNFNPKQFVTRADAVTIILNYITAQRMGIFY